MSDIDSMYIHISRSRDAVISLEQFGDSLARVTEDEKHWKFTLIAIHNALQGFMTISLRDGTPYDTWKEDTKKIKDKERWRDEAIPSEQKRVPQLDYFMNLFDKVFPQSDGIDRNLISYLNKVRNDFSHFNTDGYSISKADLKPVCKESLKAIRLAKMKAKGIVFYYEGEEEVYEAAMQRSEDLLQQVVDPALSAAQH